MRSFLGLVAIMVLAGCAMSPKVDPLRADDYRLSCAELRVEIAKLDDAQAKVDDNTGANATNIAAALVWIPGLAYTFHGAGEAARSIRERRANLDHYQESKKCSNNQGPGDYK